MSWFDVDDQLSMVHGATEWPISTGLIKTGDFWCVLWLNWCCACVHVNFHCQVHLLFFLYEINALTLGLQSNVIYLSNMRSDSCLQMWWVSFFLYFSIPSTTVSPQDEQVWWELSLWGAGLAGGEKDWVKKEWKEWRKCSHHKQTGHGPEASVSTQNVFTRNNTKKEDK